MQISCGLRSLIPTHIEVTSSHPAVGLGASPLSMAPCSLYLADVYHRSLGLQIYIFRVQTKL